MIAIFLTFRITLELLELCILCVRFRQIISVLKKVFVCLGWVCFFANDMASVL